MTRFMDPILDALNDGSVIRRGVKALVYIAAAVMVLGTLLAVIVVLKASFDAESPVATVGGLLLCLFSVAAGVCGVQVFLYRARSIDTLGPSPFTVVPVVAILIRLAGEFWAVNMVSLAIGGCLAAWLGGPLIGSVGALAGMRGMDASGSFLVGLVIFGYGFAIAAVSLVGAYFLAELLVVTVDMARSLRTLVQVAGAGSTGARAAAKPAGPPMRPTPAAAPPAIRVPPPPPIPAIPARVVQTPQPAATCAACGHPVEPDAAFCGECGAPV